MFMDSVLLGTLTNYRRLLSKHVFAPRLASGMPDPSYKLTSFGHGIAGMAAGWTVSFVAAPFEHIKARLQIQYASSKSARLYAGPIDCTTKILRHHGLWGLYRGLPATMLFRTFFFFWWSTYDLFTTSLRTYTALPEPAVNFWAGGLSAQVFWLFSYPSDVVKQRVMTDGFGADRKYRNWMAAAKAVKAEQGFKGFWRGFVPCFLRAFPANAMALLAFEGVMRALE
jgi:solute carrier family 25 carnitine/acylcarnitine transporter 20/29